ncbi:MAG: thiolase family protein [Thermodesulfobacteriota bacterium]
MSGASVIGVGMLPFGKHPEKTIVEMGTEAAHLAMEDAGIRQDQIDACFFSNGFAGRLFGDITVGQNVFWEVGINRVPVINIENACTSGSTAFLLGCNMVLAGQAEVVLVAGAEKLCVPELGLLDSGRTELDTQLGMVVPAGFAMRAIRHMSEYGTTPRQLAMVAVKNRRHGQLNPYAMFREEISLEEVLTAPVIAEPITRLQCCPNADGAAAAVICSSSFARLMQRAVKINTAVLCTGSYENPQDLSRWETDFRTCGLAYEKAGIGPEDIDLVEVHDPFTIAEILHYEALGLCKIGEGGRLAEEGHTSLGGRIPVNVSGGLLSKGHPVGATGIAQIAEIVTQLRSEAGLRQVAGARIGLAHCMGGDKAADTKSCTVTILSN